MAPFILLYICNLSSKSLLYSDIQYPEYLKSVTRPVNHPPNSNQDTGPR
jgi:hypothetical protein